MTDDKSRTNKRKLLKYQKGEQIIKQGDYGVSIYKIVSGKVRVFRESKGTEIPLATLDVGEIIGEMVFLKRKVEVRSASARAVEDTELEVWHPRDLLKKYEQMPIALKIILDQTLGRLQRMNKFMDKLAAKAPKAKKNLKDKRHPLNSRRRFYRKKIDLECKYVPSSRPKGFPPFLKGHIKDISMSGLSIEVLPKNEAATSHKQGDSFHIETTLPNGQDLNVTAEIVSVKKKRGKIRLGMKFRELAEYYGTRRTLGFFLMP